MESIAAAPTVFCSSVEGHGLFSVPVQDNRERQMRQVIGIERVLTKDFGGHCGTIFEPLWWAQGLVYDSECEVEVASARESEAGQSLEQ
jgi:hypothetical protein